MMMSSVTGHSSLRLIGLYRIVSSCVTRQRASRLAATDDNQRSEKPVGVTARTAVSGSSPHGRGAGGPGGMRLRRSSLSFDQEPTCTVQRTLRVTALPLRGPRGAVHGGAQQHGTSSRTSGVTHGALPVLSLQVPLVY